MVNRPRRALLYVPGSDERKLIKAATLGADSVCVDLEDGVAFNRKAEARDTIARVLPSLDLGKSERLVRINAVGVGMEDRDLETALSLRPDGIVVPKVHDAEQLRWVSRVIGEYERAHGLADGTIRLIGMIESARGVINLSSIAASDGRLDALIFGAEDFAADIGATRTRNGWEVWYARSAIVTTCAAFGLQAIDLLFLDFTDAEGLRAEARRGAGLGYAGMQIIHPNQVKPVQEAFTPDDAAIASALRVIQAARENLAQGRGAFALDNRMIDMPLIRAAERVLALARAADKVG